MRFSNSNALRNLPNVHFLGLQPRTALPGYLAGLDVGLIPYKVDRLGAGLLLQSKTLLPVECLHYAMNLPTSVVITGCESLSNLEQALNAARSFKPLSAAESAALLARTEQAARRGDCRYNAVVNCAITGVLPK